MLSANDVSSVGPSSAVRNVRFVIFCGNLTFVSTYLITNFGVSFLHRYGTSVSLESKRFILKNTVIG